MTLRHRCVAVLLLVPFAACSRQPSPAPPASAEVKPAPAHAVPSADAAASSADGASARTVTGPVLETMDAASYTYVRVRDDKGEVWAAAPQFPVKVGEQVSVPLEMPMKNFHSASLNRDFPVIYFVSKIAPADGSTAAQAPAAAGNPHGAPQAAPTAVTTPMPAPAGGITIAKLWGDRKALAGKPVTIHGVVVKYNAGILGLNWIHLQDGTGKAADGSNDVTVTSTEDPGVKVGDTIVASGTAAIDKNIGAGYSYPVLVENAKISAVKKTAGS